MANVRYSGVFFGREQIGKLVTVTDIRTETAAVLTADRNGTTPLANPVTVTGPEGEVDFHAPAGRYRLTANGGYSTEVSLQGDGGDTPAPTPAPAVPGSRGAATIAAPTAPGAAYAQAEAASVVAAVNALITANAAQAATIATLLAALEARGVIDDQTTD